MFTKLLLPVAVLSLFAFPSLVHADPAAGKIVKRDSVKPYETDVYTVKLVGGEATRITLTGDGDTCLELRVYDEDGRLVASDTLGFGDDRKVFVTPRRTAKYTIKIKNIGSVYNEYLLVID